MFIINSWLIFYYIYGKLNWFLIPSIFEWYFQTGTSDVGLNIEPWNDRFLDKVLIKCWRTYSGKFETALQTKPEQTIAIKLNLSKNVLVINTIFKCYSF